MIFRNFWRDDFCDIFSAIFGAMIFLKDFQQFLKKRFCERFQATFGGLIFLQSEDKLLQMKKSLGRSLASPCVIAQVFCKRNFLLETNFDETQMRVSNHNEKMKNYSLG